MIVIHVIIAQVQAQAPFVVLLTGQIRRQLEFAQEMIQRNSHQNRLEYFKDILDEEFRTSLAKKSLKNLAGPDA